MIMEEEEVLKGIKGDLMVEHGLKHPHIGEEKPRKKVGQTKVQVREVVVGHYYHNLDFIKKKRDMERKIFLR